MVCGVIQAEGGIRDAHYVLEFRLLLFRSFSDSPRQIERLITILDDMDKSVTFTPIHTALREGFADVTLGVACYTDHQVFDRYYKYKRKKGYEIGRASCRERVCKYV